MFFIYQIVHFFPLLVEWRMAQCVVSEGAVFPSHVISTRSCVQVGGTAIVLRCAADVGAVDMHFRIVREVRAQPYGDARAQAQLLRDHMIMPLLCVTLSCVWLAVPDV